MYPDAKLRRQVSECLSPSLRGSTLKHFKIQIRRFSRRLTTSGAPTGLWVRPSADIPGAHHNQAMESWDMILTPEQKDKNLCYLNALIQSIQEQIWPTESRTGNMPAGMTLFSYTFSFPLQRAPCNAQPLLLCRIRRGGEMGHFQTVNSPVDEKQNIYLWIFSSSWIVS